MYIPADTLDDLMKKVFTLLLRTKNRANPTRGEATEQTGIVLKLKNPRARLSRSATRSVLFSCLGELIWYLSGSNQLKFIQYYLARYDENSDDKKTIHGAYGPRLFPKAGVDQVQSVVQLLTRNPASRRAVIQIYDSTDLNTQYKDVPCTCSLQFLVRKNQLQMLTHMRSNDAYLGLPHDVFTFTMLQELVARSLSIEPGVYTHFVGNLHLYVKDIDNATQYIDEGWQSTIEMPSMPLEKPWNAIKKLIAAEKNIRNGREVDLSTLGLDPYWNDLIRLLQIFRKLKSHESREIAKIARNISSRVYDYYITKRQKQNSNIRQKKPVQLNLYS